MAVKKRKVDDVTTFVQTGDWESLRVQFLKLADKVADLTLEVEKLKRQNQ